MAVPEFVLALREHIGHAPLWLSGVTAVVLRDSPDGSSDPQVLLVRRADDGRWTPVTGIIDPGEEPADAAARETLEEAGVVAVAERLVLVHTLPPITYDNGDQAQYLDLVFRLRWTAGDPWPADGENTDAAWFALSALPPMTPQMHARLDAALADEPAAAFRITPVTAVPPARPDAMRVPDRAAAPAHGLCAVAVRRAGVEDAAALTRLRRVMLEAMGMAEVDEPGWQDACTAWFAARLADPAELVAFVVDGDLPDGTRGPVAGAAGDFHAHAPEPWNPSGRRGHVFNVATEPDARRRGYARACVMAVMQWFRDETEVTRVGLSATAAGRSMYEHLGFGPPRGHEMVWRIDR